MGMMDWFRSLSARLGLGAQRAHQAAAGTGGEQMPTAAKDASALTDQDLAQVQGGISSIQISGSGDSEVIPVE
jgi:hypothetical protein